ncbi:major facilitator superfamily domain-containing protein [Yarrowia lipolytica]|jgi:MFS family permease|uniref:YALI0D20834p n=2 Tax=Yarrowia lipolytica TaxID=4952 RepID=Q6C8C4_YARLI|nr:YALI0D20834p [Yarrowia lipolytica CLIB122]AOW04387.1 hypothetical protein YALI1_D26438g [Yarrowia lipolytica]KAB8285789.1 major facilitator superfamily domain-containing protein [Yarrowia lipolytica]KAE8171868.1 major facilitator superfamily domain-containing protein [Yarrowia lipolytica]KAJ8054129.1 major facilitator superfamily domain-containing protein [Yarrowia lipolytica]QNP98285.1 Putative MFS-type transporter [Yarrowia lipolytica]|eukprot:XP_503088.1 YALI0D20834p [Yarrowia lipolytica CLIB122]
MLDYEAVPGSIILVDQDQEIVVSPIPSSDPDDPLNWSRNRKLLSMFCMVVYMVAIVVPSNSLYSIFSVLTEESGQTLDELNQGTGYMFLFFGLGCLICQPLGQQYGKRPIYLLSVLGTLAVQLWSPYAKSQGAWIGSRILQGALGAPMETMCEITISDVFFEHERGRWVGVYAFALMFSSYIAPLVAGFIAEGMNWKWVFYWGSIFNGVCLVFLFFFFEETNYVREHVAQPVPKEGSVLEGSSGSGDPEKIDDYSEGRSESSLEHQQKPMKTYRQKLALWDKPRKNMLWEMFKRPFIIFFKFPPVVYAGFLYGSGIIFFNILNASASMILSAPPYNFKPSMVGLCYVSPIIVTFITSWYSGYLSDLLRIKLAKRNGGLSEPEHRLWIILIHIILNPAMLVLWGVGAYNGIHWIGPVIGMGIIGGLATIPAVSSVNYALDCYREIGSDSLVTLIVIRNCMSFGIGYGITPWITREGLKNAFGEAAGVSAACMGTFFIVLVVGKRMRKWTKKDYWNFVQKSIDNGMVH